MLWGITVGMLFLFAILFFCSITVGEWIFLLPFALVPFAVSRMTRSEEESPAYRKWKRLQERRGR